MMRGVAAFLLPLVLLCAQEPAGFRGWFDRGVAQFRSNQFRDAAASLEKAVALEPSSLAAHLYLGISYLRQPADDGVADRAEEHLLRVVQLDPNHRIAISFLGELTLRQSRLDDSQAWYEKLAALEPNNVEAHYSLGLIAWYKVERQQTARQKLNSECGPVIDAGIRSFSRVLSIQPEHEQAMLYLGKLIRARAALRDYPAESAQDAAIADQWMQKAEETRRRKAERAASVLTSTPTRVRIDADVMQSKLIHRVDPVKSGHGGPVVLDVLIDRQGHVGAVQVVSGPPELTPRAIDAVKQWIYQPTLIQGVPREVSTRVTVRF
jgi:tetratricopeptide (TPR) repeat protein